MHQKHKSNMPEHVGVSAHLVSYVEFELAFFFFLKEYQITVLLMAFKYGSDFGHVGVDTVRVVKTPINCVELTRLPNFTSAFDQTVPRSV